MSLNILELVKDQISSNLTQQAANYLGESESAIGKALGGLMPAILGSTVEKATNPAGAQGIMDLISKLDLQQLSDITGMFSGGTQNVNGLLQSGGGIVDGILGNKSNLLIDFISKYAGLKSGSSSSLLKMAAPLLMGFIGKQIQGKGVSGLTSLLMGQKEHISKQLPAGLGNIMGLSNLGNLSDGLSTATSGSTSWLKWAIPLVLGAGLVYFLSTKGCENKVVETTTDAMNTAVETTKELADSTGAMANDVVNYFQKTLSTGFALVNASPDGIESQLITFIDDSAKKVDKTTWFNFDRLLFDTGKATLQPSSKEQLVNIAEILKAYPSVKIKIGGYTDNVGDAKANLKLSTDRAFNVMNELIALGIDKTRLAAEGYGQEFPVGDNTTEEGRQQNRRIAVRVTAK